PQVELVSKLQGVPIAGLEKLTPAQTYAIAKIIIGTHEASLESLEKFGSTDLSFGVPGLSRFRVNIFKQRGTYAIVMRVIPPPPPFDPICVPLPPLCACRARPRGARRESKSWSGKALTPKH